MMTAGTVKSFNASKGYGFIKMDTGGADVFVHRSAVRTAGCKDLRKGQKVSFEIFDNQGNAAAKNLRIVRAMDGASGDNFNVTEGSAQIAQCNMIKNTPDPSIKKRTWISRDALKAALVESVRGSDPQCEGLIEIIIERVVPASRDVANWAVKGVKYGKAERKLCSAAISKFVQESQGEFEVSDWT
jgi:cold shock protein